MTPLSKTFGLIVATAMLASPISAQDTPPGIVERADISFNVRVAVEGDPRTITTGIKVRCEMVFVQWDGTPYTYQKEVTLVPNGGTFSPQTADGFIEATIVLDDVDVAENLKESSDTNGYWRCEAMPVDASFSPYFVRGSTAIRPAEAGSCPSAQGQMRPDGSTDQPVQRCAKLGG